MVARRHPLVNSEPTIRIINADVLDGLRSLPAKSIHLVVTSPPYWGLRQYLPGVMILDPSLDEETLRRVLCELEYNKVESQEI